MPVPGTPQTVLEAANHRLVGRGRRGGRNRHTSQQDASGAAPTSEPTLVSSSTPKEFHNTFSPAEAAKWKEFALKQFVGVKQEYWATIFRDEKCECMTTSDSVQLLKLVILRSCGYTRMHSQEFTFWRCFLLERRQSSKEVLFYGGRDT
jgi:hypothetical protein